MVAGAKKVLITGAEGMLGLALCSVLKEKYKISKGVFKNLDVTKKDLVSRKIRKLKPDFIIHAAAYTDVDGCELNPKKAYLVNVKGTENIADACKKHNIKLIFISTDYVFDGKKATPYVETDLAAPLNVYGSSKLEAERIIQQKLEKHFIVRTSWLYGAGGKNFVDTIIENGKKEKVLRVVFDHIGSPTYTNDLAAALLRLLDFNIYCPYGIYHITNGGQCSWFEFAKAILKIKKISSRIIPILSQDIDRPAKRPKMSLLSNKKFNRFCDCELQYWEKALGSYLN